MSTEEPEGSPKNRKSMMLAEAALIRQAGHMLKDVAKDTGLHASSIGAAHKVLLNDPDIFTALRNGEISLREAEIKSGARTRRSGLSVKDIADRNEWRIAKMREMSEQGYGVREIAKECGLTIATTRMRMNAHGIRVPDGGRGTKSIDVERVIESTIDSLNGLAAGIDSLGDLAINAETAAKYSNDLNEPLVRLRAFQRRLKETQQ